MTHRPILVGLAGVVLASVLAGCSLVQPDKAPTAEEIVGTWRSENGDGSIEFLADGTFQMSEVPADAIDPTQWDIENLSGVPEGPVTDAAGRWDIEDASEAFGPAYVFMELDDNADLNVDATSLHVARVNNDIELFFSLGDPDSNYSYVFTRTDG